MQIVPSTFLALVVIVLMAARPPIRALVPLLAVTPFGAAAAFNLPAVGGASIGVTDLAAVALFGLLLLAPGGPARIAGSMRPFSPGFWLALLAVFCVVSAMFSPRLFAGQTEVFGIARSANQNGIVVSPLQPTTGNITQLFRLVLGFLAFYAAATLLRRRPDPGLVVRAMAWATGVHVALGWIDVLLHAAGAGALLDPIRTANYAILADHRMVGLKRMIGGFPEASAFGYYTWGLFGFWLQYWVLAPRSRLAPWMLAMTTLVLLRSTSSSAYVAMVLFVITFAGLGILRNLRHTVAARSMRIVAGGAMGLWLAALTIFAAYQFADPVTSYLDRALFDKMGSSSGVERMSWNAQAFRNFTDTLGMGAGLGAIRASNWLLACLGSIGAIGTALFVAFLASLARLPATAAPGHVAAIRALKAACLAQFVSAMLTHPTPDLGIFFFALAGLAAGLSRGGVLESRTGESRVAAGLGAALADRPRAGINRGPRRRPFRSGGRKLA